MSLNTPTLTFETGEIPIPESVPTTITASQFRGSERLNGKRQILPIEFTWTRQGSGTTNNITIASTVRISVAETGGEITAINFSNSNDGRIKNTGVTKGIFSNKRLTVFVILVSPAIDKCSYKPGDQYEFNLSTKGHPIITFLRDNLFDELDKCPEIRPSRSLGTFNMSQNVVRVPLININFQSLIDGSDIGNTVFTIIDEFQYYKRTAPIKPNHNCQIIQTNNPRTTLFNKACPMIVSVMKGQGNTAWEKAEYFFNNGMANFSDIYNFFIEGLVRYSMLKYILARIMYGKFDINFIRNKYDEKFLRDLKNTRFCHFATEFTDPNSNIFGYSKYFK